MRQFRRKTKIVPPRRKMPQLWLLSVCVHIGLVALLGCVSVAVDLGTPERSLISDAHPLSVVIADSPPEPQRTPDPVLTLTPSPEPVEDWMRLPQPDGEQPPVTEFSDDASLSPAPMSKSASHMQCASAPFVDVTADFAARRPRDKRAARPVNAVGEAEGGREPGWIGVGGDSAGNGSGTGAGSGRGSGCGLGNESGSDRGAAVASSSVGTGGDGGFGNGYGLGASPPRPRKMSRGQYPSDARRAGLEGTVLLLLDVSESGSVSRVDVAQSSGSEILDRAAIDAASNWTFYPAVADRRAIASRIRMPYIFKLVDAN